MNILTVVINGAPSTKDDDPPKPFTMAIVEIWQEGKMVSRHAWSPKDNIQLRIEEVVNNAIRQACRRIALYGRH